MKKVTCVRRVKVVRLHQTLTTILNNLLTVYHCYADCGQIRVYCCFMQIVRFWTEQVLRADLESRHVGPSILAYALLYNFFPEDVFSASPRSLFTKLPCSTITVFKDNPCLFHYHYFF